MQSYDKFLPEVLSHIRDCSQEFAVNAIRNAAIQFCDETHWLTYEPDAITLLADTDTYDIEYESGVEPVRLIWAKVQDVEVKATMTFDNELVLATAPSERIFGGLTMKIAVRPTRSSTTCADTLYNRWCMGIAAGARSLLQKVPGQPYTDADRSIANMLEFRSAVADAKIERQREQTIGPLRVQMRSF